MLTRQSIRTVAFVSYALLILAFDLRSAIPNFSAQENLKRPIRGVLQECSFETGNVFLVSSMTAYGELGWLLCTNPASKHSWLYEIPRMIELYPESQLGDSLTLTSKELSDGSKYWLRGDIAGNQLSGSLAIENRLAGKSTKYVLKGFRLNTPTTGISDFPTGRYSNSRYVEESGDPAGAELILFLTGGQSAGLVKFNESYWNEPPLVPLALSTVRIISNQKLEFELRLGDGKTGRYTLTRQGRTLLLERVDVDTAPGAFKLPKQRDLLPQSFVD